MRFTSLIVELVRAKPRLIFWIVVLLQAALWFVLPVLMYDSPPGDMATVLAFGREYQVGSHIGPPLGILVCGCRVPHRGQSYFRRLSAGAGLFHRRRSGRCSLWPRHRRRPAGAFSPCCCRVTMIAFVLSRRGIRAADAGAADLGADAAACMADHGAGQAQCLVRAVDRSRVCCCSRLTRRSPCC